MARTAKDTKKAIKKVSKEKPAKTRKVSQEKAAKKARSTPEPAPSPSLVSSPAPAAVADEAESYRLDQAARRLGPGSPELAAAIHAAHSDDELHAEGIKVQSERIVADGERLVSKALVHLESKDTEVRAAVGAAGLSREWVALTAEALLHLRGISAEVNDSTTGNKSLRKLAGSSIAQSLAHGRVLRQTTRRKLSLLLKLDRVLLDRAQTSATTPPNGEQLARQLDDLAGVVRAAVSHTSPGVRTLAAARALTAQSASDLTAAAEQLRAALNARQGDVRDKTQERQATLDIQDGYCLVLLGELLTILRDMADRTPKVRRPTLLRLQGYFGARPRPEAPAPAAPASPPTP